MHTRQLDIRDFHIIDIRGNVDACAQFIYKGYMISFSTWSLTKGACQTHVRVYEKAYPEEADYSKPVKDGLRTVEEAIEFINELVAVK